MGPKTCVKVTHQSGSQVVFEAHSEEDQLDVECSSLDVEIDAVLSPPVFFQSMKVLSPFVAEAPEVVSFSYYSPLRKSSV